LDALNGIPILNIMPYEEQFDSPVGIEKELDPGFRVQYSLRIFNS